MANISFVKQIHIVSVVIFLTVFHHHFSCVHGEIESATPGSIFTTRTWMRNQVAKNPEEFMEKVVSKGCANRYTTTCMKLDVVGFVDRLSSVENYQIVPGLIVVKENATNNLPADLAASLAKEHPNDIDARLDAFLVKRVAQYLNSHSINLKLFDAESYNNARKFTEQNLGVGRKGGLGGLGGGGGGGFGGGKDKGGYGMLLAAGMMMAGTLGPMAFGTVAALAGKALMTSMMSLLLSAIIGLKGLGGGGKGVHYEIIQKPVYSHSHSHSSEVQHVDHHGGGGGGGHGGGGGGGGGAHGFGGSSYGRSFDVKDGVQSVASDAVVPAGMLFSADAQQHAHNDNNGGDAQEMAYNAYAPQS